MFSAATIVSSRVGGTSGMSRIRFAAVRLATTILEKSSVIMPGTAARLFAAASVAALERQAVRLLSSGIAISLLCASHAHLNRREAATAARPGNPQAVRQ